jgi:hypothetical protein
MYYANCDKFWESLGIHMEFAPGFAIIDHSIVFIQCYEAQFLKQKYFEE